MLFCDVLLLQEMEKMANPLPLLEWAQTASFPELPNAMLYQIEGLAMSETCVPHQCRAADVSSNVASHAMYGTDPTALGQLNWFCVANSFGTRRVFPQVIFFVEVNKPAHKELIDNFAQAIKEIEEEKGGKFVVPSLVDIGRKTRKEYEADIAERYQVKRKHGPQVRGFRRDLQTQTFGTRLQGMEPGTEMTKHNLKEYTKAVLDGKVPALGPKSEDDPTGTELELIEGVRKVVGKTFNKLVLSDDKMAYAKPQ